MPRGSKVASRKKRVAESIHDRDRIIVRLPDGMREQLARVAEANGRSVTAEVVTAIEKHLQDIDRITEIWQFIEKHRENIELLDSIWGAVIDVEGRVGKLDGNGWGTLRKLDHKIQEERLREKNPPA